MAGKNLYTQGIGAGESFGTGGASGTSDRNTIKLTGDKELQEFMRRLPKQLNNPKNLTKIWRENSKILIDKAQALAPKRSGQLAKSIEFFTTKASRKVGGGYVGPRVRGKFRSKENTGFYGAFVEYGGEVMFGGRGHGKKGNQEFMQPAYEQTKNAMMGNLLKDSRKMMLREVKRLRKFGTLGY